MSDPRAPAPAGRARAALLLAAPPALFLLVLAAAEAGARLLLPPVSSLQLFVTSAAQRHGFTDAEQVSIFEGDPLRFWRLRPGLREVAWDFTAVSTNAQGLRHRRDLGPKPPGGTRVVCLGDSVTFGYRVPVVFPRRAHDYSSGDLPYPMLLEDALQAANPGRAVDVVALAVPGYSSHQGLAWLRAEIGRLQPDLVTACFGWNDVSLRPATDRETMLVDRPHVWARAVVARSQALAHLVLWRRPDPPGAAGGRPTLRVPREEFVENHLQIVRLARGAGAQVAVMAPVYRDATTLPGEAMLLATHRAALRAAMAVERVPWLEVEELTEEGHPANRGLFGELIHPNAAGHRLLAGRLLELIARERLLPGLQVPTADAEPQHSAFSLPGKRTVR